MLAGNARVACIDPDGRILVDDVQDGGRGNFPTGWRHSILSAAAAAGFGWSSTKEFDDRRDSLPTDGSVSLNPGLRRLTSIGSPETTPSGRRPETANTHRNHTSRWIHESSGFWGSFCPVPAFPLP
jgi:hypothetical protein